MHLILPASCPTFYEPCGHTILEHIAWEAGWAAGEEGEDADTCQMFGVLREAWLCGHSAAYTGIAPYKAQQGQNGAR